MTVAPLTGDTATALGVSPETLPLFLREEWRGIVGEGYERLAVRDKDGRAVAAINLHRTRRAGLRLISHPAFNPHCGLWRRQQAKNPSKAVGEANISAHTPLRRIGDDEDLKGATLLFASDAGKHITGQVLAVDGGVSAIIGG